MIDYTAEWGKPVSSRIHSTQKAKSCQNQVILFDQSGVQRNCELLGHQLQSSMQNNQNDTDFIFDQFDNESPEQKKEKSNSVTRSSTTVFYSNTETSDANQNSDGALASDLADATSDGVDIASEASSDIAESLMDGADVASEVSGGILELILKGLLAIILFPFKLIGSLFDS